MGKKQSAGHFSVRRGKRVLVHMKNSDHSFVARFKERTDREVAFFDHSAVSTKDVRTLSIYKES